MKKERVRRIKSVSAKSLTLWISSRESPADRSVLGAVFTNQLAL